MTDKHQMQVRKQSTWQALLDMTVLLPWIVFEANRRCWELAQLFQSTIEPLLAQNIRDSDELAILRARLLPASVKGAFLIQNYARMLGQVVPAELGLIAGAFTRIYDDLMDGPNDGTLYERMATLFSEKGFEPCTDLETLFLDMYRLLEEKLPRERYTLCYEALQDVHQLQILSLRQRSATLSDEELFQITSSKGAKATLVLCGMVKYEMTAGEKEVIENLGACFQHLDDYEDFHDDVQRGVNTLAVRGHLSPAQLAARIAHIAVLLQDFYDSWNVRVFVVGLYYWLCMAFISRLLKRLGLKRNVDYRTQTNYRYILPVQLLF